MFNANQDPRGKSSVDKLNDILIELGLMAPRQGPNKDSKERFEKAKKGLVTAARAVTEESVRTNGGLADGLTGLMTAIEELLEAGDEWSGNKTRPPTFDGPKDPDNSSGEPKKVVSIEEKKALASAAQEHFRKASESILRVSEELNRRRTHPDDGAVEYMLLKVSGMKVHTKAAFIRDRAKLAAGELTGPGLPDSFEEEYLDKFDTLETTLRKARNGGMSPRALLAQGELELLYIRRWAMEKTSRLMNLEVDSDPVLSLLLRETTHAVDGLILKAERELEAALQPW